MEEKIREEEKEEVAQDDETLWAIMIDTSRDYNIPVLGSILSQHLSIPIADATAQVRYCRGVYVKGVDRKVADKIGEELGQLHQEFSLVPMEGYSWEPQVYKVGKASLEEEGIKIFFSGYREKLLERDKILAINFVSLDQQAEKKKNTWTNPYLSLFSMDLKYVEDLEKKDLSLALREEFLKNQLIIGETPTLQVDEPGQRWEIRDEEQTFSIKREGKELAVYTLQFSLKAQRVMESLAHYHSVKDYQLELFFDVFYLEGPAIYRFYRDGMNYDFLEDPKNNSLDNFIYLLEQLAPRMPEAYKTPSTTSFTEGLQKAISSDGLEKKSSADPAKLLEQSIFSKDKELRDYNTWICHYTGLYKKAIVVERESTPDRLPLSGDQRTLGQTMKWPVILGALVALYLPQVLYVWAYYRHLKYETGLSIDMARVQNIILIGTGICLVIFFVLRKLYQITYHYVGALLFVAVSLFFTYPMVLAFSKEYSYHAQAQELQIREALNIYRQRHGSFPSSLKQVYKTHPHDPWGNLWSYEKKENTFELYSAGPDAEFGNEDDVPLGAKGLQVRLFTLQGVEENGFYLFSTEIAEKNPLNKLKISEFLRKEFEEHKILLSESSMVKVVKSNHKWEIADNGKKWILENNGQTLKVYTSLNQRELSEFLRKQFEEHKILLSPKATARVIKPDGEWKIIDNKRRWFIKNEDKKLNVYSIKMAVPAPMK